MQALERDPRPGRAIEAVRRLQRNPNLGAFRVHAALAQVGVHPSPRTCGRILATNRALYGLVKPKGPAREKKEMPFAASRRHQFWTADVRYVDDHKLGGRAYRWFVDFGKSVQSRPETTRFVVGSERIYGA